MGSINNRPIQILLVEDSPSDAKLTKKALKHARVTNEINHITDGIKAMEFLKQQGEYIDAPRPDLILLDLNLPRKKGLEILEEIKQDPELQAIPVVIITSSHEEEDILRSYNLHANSYVTKPVDFEKFLEIVHCIEGFWLTVVMLPGKKM